MRLVWLPLILGGVALLVGVIVLALGLWRRSPKREASPPVAQAPRPAGLSPVSPAKANPPADGKKSSPPAGGNVAGATGWQEYKDPDGLFTVLLPGTPRRDRDLGFTAFERRKGQDVVATYLVQVFDGRHPFAPKTVQEMAKSDRMDTELKFVKDQAVQVKGHEAWELVFKDTYKRFVRTQYVKVKGAILFVCATVADTPDEIAAANKFVDSFTPLDK
jgi:hypothetical protein